jgi:hypothetical protein
LPEISAKATVELLTFFRPINGTAMYKKAVSTMPLFFNCRLALANGYENDKQNGFSQNFYTPNSSS